MNHPPPLATRSRTVVAALVLVAATLVGVVGAVSIAPQVAAAADVAIGSGATIGSGQTVTATGSGHHLTMQTDGNLVLYHAVAGGRRAAWASGTNGRPGSYAVQQTDGNLVIYQPLANGSRSAVWASGTNGRGGAYTVVQDDGNLVMYQPTASGRVAVWATGTSAPPPPPPPAPDTGLTSGARLTSGATLTAGSGHHLVMQTDGNLVWYTIAAGQPRKAAWASGTNGHPGAYADVQTDGNVVVYGPLAGGGRTALWASGTNGNPGAYLVAQSDGNLVVYTANSAGRRPLWSSASAASAVQGVVFPPRMTALSGGYFRMPDPVGNDPWTWNGGTPASQRCGSHELVGLLYTAAVEWARLHPGGKLVIGDLNATGHKSHQRGIDVDVKAQVGGVWAADSTRTFSAPYTLQLAEVFARTGLLHRTDNFWNPAASRAQVNASPVLRGQGVTFAHEPGHEDHFHLRLRTAPLATRTAC